MDFTSYACRVPAFVPKPTSSHRARTQKELTQAEQTGPGTNDPLWVHYVCFPLCVWLWPCLLLVIGFLAVSDASMHVWDWILTRLPCHLTECSCLCFAINAPFLCKFFMCFTCDLSPGLSWLVTPMPPLLEYIVGLWPSYAVVFPGVPPFCVFLGVWVFAASWFWPVLPLNISFFLCVFLAHTCQVQSKGWDIILQPNPKTETFLNTLWLPTNY